MMKFFISVMFLLISMPVFAQSTLPDTDDEKVLQEFLSNPKNPFISPLEKKDEVLKPVEPPKEKSLAAPVEAPAPEPVKKPELPQLNLIGLVWGGDKPQAIIDDQIVNIGDSIKNAKVVAITEIGVDLEYEGEKVLLKRK
jgi:hypothetical protein